MLLDYANMKVGSMVMMCAPSFVPPFSFEPKRTEKKNITCLCEEEIALAAHLRNKQSLCPFPFSPVFRLAARLL